MYTQIWCALQGTSVSKLYCTNTQYLRTYWHTYVHTYLCKKNLLYIDIDIINFKQEMSVSTYIRMYIHTYSPTYIHCECMYVRRCVLFSYSCTYIQYLISLK